MSGSPSLTLPPIDPCLVFGSLSSRVRGLLETGYQYGLQCSETTVTDLILLALATELPNRIWILKFGSKVEGTTTGADWEWWMRIDQGWYGMRLQAKRLDPDALRYEGIDRCAGRGRRFQFNLLIRDARLRGLYPAYCFYNYWPDPRLRPSIWKRGVAPPTHLLGCALADAVAVRAKGRAGQTGLSDIAPISEPWTILVCPAPRARTTGLVSRVADAAERLANSGSANTSRLPQVREQPPDYVAALMKGERGLAVQLVRETPLDALIASDLSFDG